MRVNSWSLCCGALAAIVTMGVLAGCGGGGDPAPADPAVKRGKVVYDRVCATCHGQDATGMQGLGKDLHANAFAMAASDAELVEFMKEGREATHELNETGVAMPPKGGDPTITDDELGDVVAYLRTLE